MTKLIQRFKDFLLEARIKSAFCNVLLAADGDEARRCNREMASLIARRSPAQIARMERKRGLA